MHNTYFVSDTHLGHANVIKYSNRPFKDVEEMNETIISNWNSIVTPEDTVYHLGDVSFTNQEKTEKYLSRLNGTIYHLRGNHDRKLRTTRFEWSRDYFELNIEDKDAHRGSKLIILCHYPMATWNKSHHGSLHLHGHCHGNLPKDFNIYRLDVGVDCWNYSPVSYAQIKKEFQTNYNPPSHDHHGNEIDL